MTADPLNRRFHATLAVSADLAARRLADARAHATLGDRGTAASRLAELGDVLGSYLGDARAAFYHDAFPVHADPAIHRTDAGPSLEGERIARTAAIAGRDQQAELLGAVGMAAAELPAAAQAGGEALTLWEARHRDAVTRHMRTALSDSQMALYHAVGRVLVRPELR